MKQASILFFSTLTFFVLVIFSSCSKEEVKSYSVPEVEAPTGHLDNKASSRSAVGINMGPLTLTTRVGHPDCVMSYGLCINIDPIYAPETDLAENQAMYVAYANEEGTLVLKLDGSSHSESFIQSIIDDPFFRLADDLTVAEEIVVGAYESSGQTPPSDPFVLLAGEYDVLFDGERFTTSVNTPWGGIVLIEEEIY